MNETSRFVDKGDGTLLDNDTGLVWSKEDSWPVAQDWLTFQEALLFADEMNKKDYLGYHDWRIPEREEIEQIFIIDSTIMGRSNSELHLDPLFAAGGGNASWCLPFVWPHSGSSPLLQLANDPHRRSLHTGSLTACNSP